jgi:succinate dehydrogenase / fumarate reductase membrane anchor subunit
MRADQPTAGAPPATAPAAAPVGVSPITRARIRPARGGRELLIWYLMRITGVALFVLALAHFSILHFIWDPAEQTAEFIAAERWNQIFWRGFDWLLLMTVLFHAFLGMRTVALDYVHRPVWRAITLSVLYVTAVVILVIGTQVILTLPVPGAE